MPCLEADQDSLAVEFGVSVHLRLQPRGLSGSCGVEGHLREPVQRGHPFDLEFLGQFPADGRQDGGGAKDHQQDGQHAEDAQDAQLHAGSASIR